MQRAASCRGAHSSRAARQAELAKARCLERLQLSPDAELALLRHAGLEIIRQREQVVFRAGDAGDRFLLILAGALNVEARPAPLPARPSCCERHLVLQPPHRTTGNG